DECSLLKLFFIIVNKLVFVLVIVFLCYLLVVISTRRQSNRLRFGLMKVVQDNGSFKNKF
ncbi:hypothetical protein RN001_009432, partial [Aquatica leii]